MKTLVAADQQLQAFVANVDGDDQLVADLNAGLASEPGRLWTPEVLAEMKERLAEKLAKNET